MHHVVYRLERDDAVFLLKAQDVICTVHKWVQIGNADVLGMACTGLTGLVP